MKSGKSKYNLTDNEYKILQFVAKGLSNKQIGDHLYVSAHTIKAQLSIILKKLNAENRSHAVYIATKEQIID